MEIVVAQYRDSPVPQGLDKPQYLQRLRSTVHEITSEPESVACTIKMQTVEQGEQGGKTALHISNSINSHLRLSGQCACVNSASRSLGCTFCLALYCTLRGCLQSLASLPTAYWTLVPVYRTPDYHPSAPRLARGCTAPLPLGLDKTGRTGYGRSTQDDMDRAVRGKERKETTCGASTRTHGNGRSRRPLHRGVR